MIILRHKGKDLSNFQHDILSTIISVSQILIGSILNKIESDGLGDTKKYNKFPLDKIKKYIASHKDSDLILCDIKLEDGMSSFYLPYQDLLEEYKKHKDEFDVLIKDSNSKNLKTSFDVVKLALEKKKDVIAIDDRQEASLTLLHEFGHYLDHKERNNSNFLQLIRNNARSNGGFKNFITIIFSFLGPVENIISLVLRYIAKIPSLKEEITASYKAVQMLKEIGFDEEQIKLAKKYYRLAFRTYLSSPLITNGYTGILGSSTKVWLSGEIGRYNK